MKRLLPRIMLFAVLILLWLGCFQAGGTDWKLYHTSDDMFYFYDSSSLRKCKGILRVSEKTVFRRVKEYNLVQALNETAKIEKKSQRQMDDELHEEMVNGFALQLTISLYEIECSKNRYRVITGMKYDKEETLIDGMPSTKWDDILPGSTIEKLHNAVCH